MFNASENALGVGDGEREREGGEGIMVTVLI